jgi:hypothetical protein
MIARLNLVPASCAHLDRADIEAALVETYGNVTAAAKKLHVPPVALRALVQSAPSLTEGSLRRLSGDATKRWRFSVTASIVPTRRTG